MKNIIKNLLASAIIGIVALVVLFMLHGFMDQVVDHLKIAIFAWSEKEGLVSIYLFIGSIVCIITLGYSIKEYGNKVVESLAESDPLSTPIYIGIGLFFVPIIIIFGVFLWPGILFFWFKNLYY